MAYINPFKTTAVSPLLAVGMEAIGCHSSELES